MTHEEAIVLTDILEEMEAEGSLTMFVLNDRRSRVALWKLLSKEIMERIDADESAKQQVEMEL